MVTKESVEQQLKDIGVKYWGWGRSEIAELPSIILPDEEIYECANGVYEGGFALLVSTNVRVILVDKKPMRYLTVEDLRFDMISEIDYSRRLLASQISISTGSKNLRFISLNHERLRKLIGHVQHCMAENKKKQAEHSEDQKQHLEQINQQLQAYLLVQHQQQQKIQEYLSKNNPDRQVMDADLTSARPDPQLSDYLYAQSLLAEHRRQGGQVEPGLSGTSAEPGRPDADELYRAGVQEVFGSGKVGGEAAPAPAATPASGGASVAGIPIPSLEVNPLKVAYSKLPLAMRNKRFGRPSFHAHSQVSAG